MTVYFGIIIEYQLKAYTIRPRFRETPFRQPKYNRLHMSMPNRGKKKRKVSKMYTYMNTAMSMGWYVLHPHIAQLRTQGPCAVSGEEHHGDCSICFF